MAEVQTTTKTATQQATVPENKGELAVFSPPRLPFHPAIEERFGVDRGQWKALVEAVFPAAKTPDAVALALSYCKARKLDPFKRVVHIVPIWNSEKTPGDKGRAKGGYVETVWPGIAEHRTTASRTNQHAGNDPARFGPTIEKVFELGSEEEGTVRNLTVKFPEWCEITVYKIVQGQRCAFPSPRVYWLETYSRVGKSSVPNEKWQRSPVGMLEKCTEAAGLRRAFPEEIGDEPTAEEAGAFTHAAETPDPPPRPTRDQFKPEEKATEADVEEVVVDHFEWVKPDGEIVNMNADTFASTMVEAIEKAVPDRMEIVWENNSGQVAKLDEKTAMKIRDAMDARAAAEAKAKAQAHAETTKATDAPHPTKIALPYGPVIDLAEPSEIPVPPKAKYPEKGAQTKAWVTVIIDVANKAPAERLIDWYNMNKATVDNVKKISAEIGASIDAAFQTRYDAQAKTPEPAKGGLFEDDAPELPASMKRT